MVIHLTVRVFKADRITGHRGGNSPHCEGV